MKFGVRECANIVFRAKQNTKIGTEDFKVGQPVLYIDTATTSTLEQASTAVYAQGGRGNSRLIAWEGDKTLTFTVTDALLSPIGFAVLSGAGLFKEGPKTGGEGEVHFHMTSMASADANGVFDLTDVIAEFGTSAKVCADDAPLFIMETEDDGSLTGKIYHDATVDEAGKKITCAEAASKNAMIDYYVDLPGKSVWEADITADTFAGFYYVEADTLFREQATGKDLPANLTFPNVKIQSNFTIAMAGTGDPSTFDFTMDAFPGYTYFDKTKKVLCVLQIVDSSIVDGSKKADKPVMPHTDAHEHQEPMDNDSTDQNDGDGGDDPTPGPTPVDPVVITIDPAQADGIELEEGATVTLNVTVEPTGTELSFSSSDDNVAMVDNAGEITAIGEGTATITVTDGADASATVEVTVTAL